MAEHPVVVDIGTDGETDASRPALYVNHQFTRHFAGWTAAESQPLLQYLLHHAVSAQHVVRHRWSAGDLVIWDNRQTMHYGIYDHISGSSGSGGESASGPGGDIPVRELHRTTADYTRPAAYNVRGQGGGEKGCLTR